MTNQCEAFGTDTRKKLSNWLAYDNHHSAKAGDMLLPSFPANGLSAIEKVMIIARTIRLLELLGWILVW